MTASLGSGVDSFNVGYRPHLPFSVTVRCVSVREDAHPQYETCVMLAKGEVALEHKTLALTRLVAVSTMTTSQHTALI